MRARRQLVCGRNLSDTRISIFFLPFSSSLIVNSVHFADFFCFLCVVGLKVSRRIYAGSFFQAAQRLAHRAFHST